MRLPEKHRIGILLPVDKRTRISVLITGQACVITVSPSERWSLPPGSRVDFSIDGGAIRVCLDNECILTDSPAEIGTSYAEMRPGEGITVHDVQAGRGMHWETKISVTLPGVVEISLADGFLNCVNIIAFEDYVTAVSCAEMSGDCPLDLVAAQMIVARSWLAAHVEDKHRDLGLDACNDDCCQRYQGCAAVTQHVLVAHKLTAGCVLTHDGEICDARYSKCCGGVLESSHFVWEGYARSYLSSKSDGGELGFSYQPQTEQGFSAFLKSPDREAYCSHSYVDPRFFRSYLGGVDTSLDYFRWRRVLPVAHIADGIDKLCRVKGNRLASLEAIKRGRSGRIIVLGVQYQAPDGCLKWLEVSGELVIRKFLDPSLLFSSAIIFGEINPDVEQIEVWGLGWGHGVGLCQIGALGMALRGTPYEEILKHYYPGAEIVNLCESDG